MKQKKYDEAISYINKALELTFSGNPNEVIFYSNLGALYQRLKREDDAMQAYDTATELNASYHGTYINRGELYSVQRKYELAITDFQKAYTLFPHIPHAQVGLALANYQVGSEEQAYEIWQKLAETDARHTYAQWVEKEYDFADELLASVRQIIENFNNRNKL